MINEDSVIQYSRSSAEHLVGLVCCTDERNGKGGVGVTFRAAEMLNVMVVC